MAFLGIEISDSGIAGVSGDQLVFVEPGCALVEPKGVIFGAAAKNAARTKPAAFHDRYWCDLSEAPLAGSIPQFETLADLAYGQLKHLWERFGSGMTEVAFAVPAYWSRDQLALLLGIAQEVGIPLTGLVEIPVAATRRSYPDYELVHIEAGLHNLSLSRISQDGAAAVVENEIIPELGTVAIERSCVEYIARRFLDCNRFDPMHDALSEQGIYDQLNEWIALLNRNGEAKLHFTYKENQFTADASLNELRQWLQRRSQPLIQALRAKGDVARPTALQLSAGLAAYPGIAETLADLPGCDVFVLEPGAAARGLVQRQTHLLRTAGSFSVTPSLPWDQPPAEVSLERAMSTTSGGVPSHLVLDGQAYRLATTPLRLGAEATAGEYSLVIDGRHKGVSRQHCSIELRDGRVVLNEHSRYGTRLNGHPVDASVVLQSGDVISVGDPACELKLIVEIGPTGQGNGT
jgi:hypothetical protein